MEKTMSVEEKIRKAEEIYYRRKGVNNEQKYVKREQVDESKKDVKLLKKMVVQIVICLIIYAAFYIIQNNQFVFSQDFINKAKEVLSYDTNFEKMFENIKNNISYFNQNNGIFVKNTEENNVQEQNTENVEENKSVEESATDSAIGGAEEEQNLNKSVELSQEEQDINNVKNTTTFIKPLDGIISSKFGYRETATGAVPKNHTGTDIAASFGTKIMSATDGEIVLASEEGDYGKHLKVQIGEVAIIYAHCNQLYVKQGEHVKQGQEIAEVGSTGNSTGPHLHFEVRYQERIVDPQKILEI